MTYITDIVLKKIKSRLEESLKRDLEAFYAFGSRIRGDHDSDSDFDLLVVVKNRTTRKIDQVIDIIVDTENEYGMSFFPVIKDSESFNLEKKYSTPFYQNITNEGVRL